jgi:hypothetical protein
MQTKADVDAFMKRFYEENKPIREQVITAYEVREPDLYWIAHLTADEHFFVPAATEQEAIGQLWLNYPQKIIERCKDANIAG